MSCCGEKRELKVSQVSKGVFDFIMSKVRGIIMDIKELNDQDIARLEKLPKYRELGVDPFGKAYKISHHSDEIRKLCNKKSSAQLEKMNLVVTMKRI